MDNLKIKHTDILSQNSQNLTQVALKEKENYLSHSKFKQSMRNGVCYPLFMLQSRNYENPQC